MNTTIADEGMWLFTNPPRKQLKEKYGFEPTDKWLDHLQRSAVRFNSGGSGSFVSADGLVMTNHHVGADALAKLSTPEHDYLNEGFHAKTRADEIPCVDLELNVLMKITDVTDKINAAVKAEMSPAESEKARRAAMNTLEKEAKDQSGLRSNVVTLYQGGQYHLYQYKQYTDVRLAFAPEIKIAFFGGDPDNFEYPRYDLDVCFFRVYEDKKPIKPEHYLKWSASGAKDGELVFVAGHPGKTDRLNTVAHLEFMRDRTFPAMLTQLRRREVLLKNYAERSTDNAFQAQDDLFGIQNSRKAQLGGMAGLQDPVIMNAKRAAEEKLRGAIASNKDHAEAGKAFDVIDKSLHAFLPDVYEFGLLEGGQAFNSQLFHIAHTLVQAADERAKPNAERLREFSDAGLDSLQQELFSIAPIYEALEIVKLADSLGFYQEMRGGNGPLSPYTPPEAERRTELMNKVFAGKSPRSRAAELVKGSKLMDVAERKKLYEGGKAAIDASTDPMIQLAKLIDPAARVVRKKYEATVEEPLRQSYAKIARANSRSKGRTTTPTRRSRYVWRSAP
ncbi:MAG: S46 family peptidase [Pirellulales bacterium]